MSVKELWRKQWVKNAVFFGIMALVFFTDIPRWFTVQYVRYTLSTPDRITPTEQGGNSVYGFDIGLSDASGVRTKLSNLSGGYVFLNLWASWCVPCLAEFASIEAMSTEVPELNIVVASIEDQRAFDKYVKKTAYDLPFYRITTPMPSDLNAPSIPATYILNPAGVVIYRHFGAIDWSDESVIQQLKTMLK